MTNREKYVLEHYTITEDGKIFSKLNTRFKGKLTELKTTLDKDGYKMVILVCEDNGYRRPFGIHRLVALKYIPNPNNYSIINHKNLIKDDNRVENLEWCTVAYNTQHGFDNCVYQNIQKVKITLNNGEIYIFPSASHAARFFGYANPSVISWFLSRHKSPRNGKLYNAIIEYTNEDVTTIERNLSTVTEV